MKPLGPIRPEPSPPQAGLWTVVLALGLMTVGIGFALYGFYDAGAIGGRAFLAIMAFVVALSAGLVAAIDAGPRDVRADFGKDAPSFDIHAVWPPEDARRSGHGRAGKKPSGISGPEA